jgi:hypothetical protein
MKNDIENIRISLPDYIKGNISDEKEIEKIEIEIRNNPYIKKEFESLKESTVFLDSVKLQNPPNNYFNSLLPRINNAIKEKETSKKNIFSLIKINRYYWRYLVPVIPVILLFLIYTSNFKDYTYKENPVYSVNENKIDLSIIDSEINSNENENELLNSTDYVKDSLNNVENKADVNDFVIKKGVINVKENHNRTKNTENIDEDNSEIPDIFSEDEDDLGNLQSKFNQLDEETQNNILNNLKNEKL